MPILGPPAHPGHAVEVDAVGLESVQVPVLHPQQEVLWREG